MTFPQWPVRIAGIVVIGAVVHAMAILMHEGVHGNLFRNEPLDRWVGFLLGAPALFSCMAYRVNHLLHHAYNRTEKDPDEFTNLSRSRGLLSLAFYAWLLVGMPSISSTSRRTRFSGARGGSAPPSSSSTRFSRGSTPGSFTGRSGWAGCGASSSAGSIP